MKKNYLVSLLSILLIAGVIFIGFTSSFVSTDATSITAQTNAASSEKRTTVGSTGFYDEMAIYPLLANDSTDTPYIACQDNGIDKKSIVMKYKSLTAYALFKFC